MKKILFPTDFSKSANNAFTYAALLAEKLEATVDILHIYSIPFSTAAAIPYDGMQQLLDERAAKAHSKVAELLAEFPTARIGDQKLVYGVFVASEIAEAAINGNYDLIVMGMKGEHNPSEKWLGTVTTDLMMKPTCPILAIPENAKFKGIKNIAFATDLKPTDELPTEKALDFAETLDAELEFVYVDTLWKTKQKTTDEATEGVVDLHYTKILNPSVVDGLDEYVRENQTDILSLYIPRRRLWERLFHLRTTKAMAFHTEIPLLIFHS